MQNKNPDYIIVGGGTAGSVLAARLTESANVSVHILEAGPVGGGLMSKIPAALDYALHDDRLNWYYHTDPEPYMDDRRMYCPRGRVLGGSSAINGMQFIRGNPKDFDGWAEQGLVKWSYAHCLPYFKKMECYQTGGDDYRGDNGPLHVSPGKIVNPLDQAYLDATQQAGHLFSEDTNGFQQEGFGLSDRNTYRGQRWSAADAYLKPAMTRPQVSVTTGALCHRIIFDQRRAIGVEYELRGEKQTLFAEREILLCGGTINSPQLLMLSGLGDAGHLKQMDIPLIQHMPGVGSNLQDHLDLRIQVKCAKPVSIYPSTKGLRRISAGLQWLATRRGICATNLFEVAGYIRTREDLDFPNLQSTFMPVAASYDGSSSYHGHGYQAHIDMMRPTSRGRIQLKSNDPRAHPSIIFNYLQTQEDQQDVIDAVRITREILAQDAFAPFADGELAPGPALKSDSEVLAWARVNGETEYHPTSSCSMGLGDEAVVNADLEVYGVDGLRVIDASIMPRVVTANTHATTLMIAEKAADLIAGRMPLDPLKVPLFTDH